MCDYILNVNEQKNEFVLHVLINHFITILSSMRNHYVLRY
jgi:hypothetical protein